MIKEKKDMGEARSSRAGVQGDSPRGLHLKAELSEVSFGIK